jgi:hypothetical protein
MQRDQTQPDSAGEQDPHDLVHGSSSVGPLPMSPTGKPVT